MNPLDNIRVVLVGTLYTGNVGSSCRAMANMGIRHLRLAAPNLQNSGKDTHRKSLQTESYRYVIHDAPDHSSL